MSGLEGMVGRGSGEVGEETSAGHFGGLCVGILVACVFACCLFGDVCNVVFDFNLILVFNV